MLMITNEVVIVAIVQVIQFRQDSTVYVGGVPDTIPALQPSPSFVGKYNYSALFSKTLFSRTSLQTGKIIPFMPSFTCKNMKTKHGIDEFVPSSTLRASITSGRIKSSKVVSLIAYSKVVL